MLCKILSNLLSNMLGNMLTNIESVYTVVTMMSAPFAPLYNVEVGKRGNKK